MIFGLMTDAKQRVLELERLAIADANRRKQSQGRIWPSRDWEHGGFSIDYLREARKHNGVGRPPLANLARELIWIAKPRNIARAAGVRIGRGDRPWIYEPPSNPMHKRRQYFVEHGWCYPLIFSTAALRKSKRRKGRA